MYNGNLFHILLYIVYTLKKKSIFNSTQKLCGYDNNKKRTRIISSEMNHMMMYLLLCIGAEK